MGHGPQGYGPPIQPDITLRAGLQQSHPHLLTGDHDHDQGGGDDGLDGFFTQSLATTQSSGSAAAGLRAAYERDQGSDGELLALLDVFHTDNHHHDNNNQNNYAHGARASQRANGYDDPLGAPFLSHEGQGLGGTGGGYDESDGQGVFTSVTAVGGLQEQGQGQGQGLDHLSSSYRGVGEEKGGEGVGGSGRGRGGGGGGVWVGWI